MNIGLYHCPASHCDEHIPTLHLNITIQPSSTPHYGGIQENPTLLCDKHLPTFQCDGHYRMPHCDIQDPMLQCMYKTTTSQCDQHILTL